MSAVEFAFLGKIIRLKLTITSLSDLEDRTGRSVLEFIEKRMTFAALRWLFWAGIRGGGNPGYTPELAGQQLQKHLETGGSLAEVSERVLEAVRKSGLFATQTEEVDGESDPLPTAKPASDGGSATT